MTVCEIQQALRTIGRPLAVDGVYGERTTAAVYQLQRGYALETLDPATGRAGPQTQAALHACVRDGGHTSSTSASPSSPPRATAGSSFTARSCTASSATAARSAER